jgi:hypothetical protein
MKLFRKDRGEWIRTRSGKKFYFEDPLPEEVVIEDIAFSLAGINRFTGHSRVTVAQHCVVGSYQVPKRFALEFLLHDAAEAYIGDVNRPLKKLIGKSYRRINDRIDRVIRAKYGLPFIESSIVKLVDGRMCLTESRDQMGDGGHDWKFYKVMSPFPDVHITPCSPEEAELNFLERFHELYEHPRFCKAF